MDQEKGQQSFKNKENFWDTKVAEISYKVFQFKTTSQEDAIISILSKDKCWWPVKLIRFSLNKSENLQGMNLNSLFNIKVKIFSN